MIRSALLSYGVALNVARPLQQKYGGTSVIWRGQVAGRLLTAPLGIPEVWQAHWSPVPLLSLIALGVVLRNERVEPISAIGSLVCLTGAWLMKRASSH